MPVMPKTQTLLGPATTAELIVPRKVCWVDQLWPFQCAACPPWPKAHASEADVAPAATISWPFLPGNATLVQLDPLRFHAVGVASPRNAQPAERPSVATAVNWPKPPAWTCLTILQDDPAAGPTEACAATADTEVAPAMASTAAVPTAARRLGRRSRDRRGAPPATDAPPATVAPAATTAVHGTALMICVS